MPGIRSETTEDLVELNSFWYTFVPGFYFMFAILSYSGRFCWRKMQGKQFFEILSVLLRTSNSEEDKTLQEAAKILVGSRVDYQDLWKKFLFCIIVNLAASVLQFVILHVVVGFSYWHTFYKIFQYFVVPYKDWPFDLVEFFPMMASCKVPYYGITGEMTFFGALCSLHFNKIYQTLFATHWILLTVIIPLNLCSFVYNLISFFSKNLYAGGLVAILKRESNSEKDVEFVHTLDTGTLFVLQIISKNVSPRVLRKLICNFRNEHETQKIV